MPNLGPTELLVVFGILILLFGARKLPDLARGTGRALRIFRTETRGFLDDGDDGEDWDSTKSHRDDESARPTSER